ncbi:hypothetical protein [Sporosarcina sp. FSL K6-5500]|uniref:hypothetical protein n=1 Tax=Sporosarcina sp. FSL K6-5500 TaxID=2921558 RepID=UPI0030F8D8D3
MTNQAVLNVLEDDRVQEILTGLVSGRTREELSNEFNHKTYKTLDIYMRRKGFTWDADQQNYALKQEDTASQSSHVDMSKASRILQLLKDNAGNAKIVATQLGFSDHKELATYMLGRGYSWDSEENTYMKKVKLEASVEPVTIAETEPTQNAEPAVTTEEMHLLAEYLPILRMLKQNEAKLVDILKPYGTLGSIPRYMIPGIAKTKTVQMVHSLDQMVVEFANEKSMTQRDVFEVALIDFFKNYGYQQQMEQLLR